MHTPGPWKTKEETNYEPAQVWIDTDKHENQDQIADVYGDSCAIRKANARLIAAAPDLLAACKNAAVLRMSDACRQFEAVKIVVDMCEKAIAKAEGK